MPQVLSTHKVLSDRDPHRSYTVTIHDTHAHCSCPAWRNSKLPDTERVCKHIESITGELRKGDARLTDDESAWVIQRLLDMTDLSFQSIADAVEQEFSGDGLLSEYERQLAGNVVITLRGSRQWEGDEASGARRATGAANYQKGAEDIATMVW